MTTLTRDIAFAGAVIAVVGGAVLVRLLHTMIASFAWGLAVGLFFNHRWPLVTYGGRT